MAIDTNLIDDESVETASLEHREAKPGRRMNLSFSFSRSVKTHELLFFYSQLSLMSEIGTPMNIALGAIKDQTENMAFKAIIEEMLQDVEAGNQLSDAMGQHPKVFNKIVVSMVKAGETVGSLKTILDRIVEMEERRQSLIAQLRSALTYPMVLCVLSIVVVIFVLVGVLPKFITFFEGKESILPFTTRFLIILSRSIQSYWWAYLLSSIALAAGLKYVKDSETGSAVLDKLILSGPVVSGLSNKIYNCQLLRTLGNLMESHVPLLEALEVTRGTIGNRYFREFIDKIMVHVREGGRFSRPFADHAYTLTSIKQMLATGDEAGNLPRVMLRLAEFYDEEVDRELKSLSSMIEPLALVVMGGAVGLIVSSVILPLFKMAHVVQ